MPTGFARGHEIHYDHKKKQWLYSDDNSVFNDDRECARCGRKPTREGYDACIGFIENAKSACCGHGKEKTILMGV